jgi:hypothetical protein
MLKAQSPIYSRQLERKRRVQNKALFSLLILKQGGRFPTGTGILQ